MPTLATKPIPGAVAPSGQALATYWRKVARKALPYLSGRPLKLVRHENGEVFYHENREPLPSIPNAVHQLTIRKRDGTEGVRVWIDDLPGLLGLIDIDVVEIHPWGARVDDIERPDVLVFDLHPGPEVDFGWLIETAFKLRHILRQESLTSWPKTTGLNDLHIYVPIERSFGWDMARAYCKMIAKRLAATAPERYTFSPGVEARRSRIYIDVLRNGRGATAIGPYSPISHPGFPIARPLKWAELEEGLDPTAFTMDHPNGLRTDRHQD